MRRMRWYPANKYALTKRLKQSVLLVESRDKIAAEFHGNSKPDGRKC